MSAHVLRYRYLGAANPVNLYGGTVYLMDYAPLEGEPGATEVTEPVSLQFTGSSRLADFQALQAALYAAYCYKMSGGREGYRVLVEFQPGGSGDFYRSELLGGPAALDPAWLHGRWSNQIVDVTIQWTRANYWDVKDVVELALTNGHGTAVTGGIQVDNHDDAGHDNWVTIPSTQALGSLPSPIFLSLENTYNVAANAYLIYAGMYTSYDGVMPARFLEGEDATGATETDDANSSNGHLGRVTWAGDTSALRLRWTLAAALLACDHKRDVLLLGRFPASPSGIQLQAKLSFPVGASPADLVEAEEIIATADALQPIGSLQLGPWASGLVGTMATMYLDLHGQKTGGATLDLDFLEALPLDSWRIYEPSTRGLLYGDILKDDPDTGLAYVNHVSGFTGYSGLYSALGGPLLLQPGYSQRLYLLASNDAAASETVRTFTLRAYYRTRKRTI
ncbi:MAG: hypothetical protein WC869_10375 [Phycisphaerae bacterium]|jgi:hypothetical protein